MSKIVLGVSGSIAAYKAAELTSKLVKEQHEVFVVLTENASKFVGALTFQTLSQNPVVESVFDEQEGWKPGHIELADEADLLLVAPCTANVVAKLANGFADDALSAIALATLAPVLIAPAMNGKMWQHPATRENVAKLRGRGVSFVDPAEGLLACGYEGIGRLAETDAILRAVGELLAMGKEIKPK